MITINAKHLNIKPGDHVLDMGCGSGRHMGNIVRRAGVSVTGCDLRIDDLSAAADRLRFLEDLSLANGRWQLSVADITRLPFRNRYFDAIICSEVLEHVPAHETAVAELARVLKPGGILAVSVPRRWPERICWKLSNAYACEPGGHIRIYRFRELSTLLNRQGFVLTGRHYAHAFHTPFWWLKCLCGLDRADYPAVAWYHRFLVWEMMNPKPFFRSLERLLNPVLGKSAVGYFKKKNGFSAPPSVR